MGMEEDWGKGRDVTFPANHLVTIIFGRQGLERGLDDAAAETEDEVEGRFLVSTNKCKGISVIIFPKVLTPIRWFLPSLLPFLCLPHFSRSKTK